MGASFQGGAGPAGVRSFGDWTEKTSNGDVVCNAGTKTILVQSSIFIGAGNAGKWWVPTFFSCGILCGATPPTSITLTAEFVQDFDQGNGAGGTDVDTKTVPLNVLTANNSFFWFGLFQLFGVCAFPQDGVILKVSLTAAAQQVTAKHDFQLSAYSFPALV